MDISVGSTKGFLKIRQHRLNSKTVRFFRAKREARFSLKRENYLALQEETCEDIKKDWELTNHTASVKAAGRKTIEKDFQLFESKYNAATREAKQKVVKIEESTKEQKKNMLKIGIGAGILVLFGAKIAAPIAAALGIAVVGVNGVAVGVGFLLGVRQFKKIFKARPMKKHLKNEVGAILNDSPIDFSEFATQQNATRPRHR